MLIAYAWRRVGLPGSNATRIEWISTAGIARRNNAHGVNKRREELQAGEVGSESEEESMTEIKTRQMN
ncbi:hypothetical protein GN244_ATG16552 [Phytophthora infestans]|uniref:Uncharacterized protein n=1 Tax=Phytophthora infestans TaxID=4787 RepID=A0A833W6A5_PHYIN|nr:hypothetical protein GN244_ATG16552 [Phytophthora infestans]